MRPRQTSRGKRKLGRTAWFARDCFNEAAANKPRKAAALANGPPNVVFDAQCERSPAASCRRIERQHTKVHNVKHHTGRKEKSALRALALDRLPSQHSHDGGEAVVSASTLPG